MHHLYQHIKEYTDISEDDFRTLRKYFVQRNLKRRHFLLEEGDACSHIAFIKKGALRQFYVDEKGVEHNVNLYVENWWVGDRESFITGSPSIYNIEAWEDCELLLLSRDHTLMLRKQHSAFRELLWKLDDEIAIATQKRITYLTCFSTEVRFKHFADCYPFFLERFPQHIIASYLGITKDTLSRLKRKSQ
jgi:CRP-like cAMP-binding protein